MSALAGQASSADPWALVGLTPLMRHTLGRPDVIVGLLDGPVAIGQSRLTERIIRRPSDGGADCSREAGSACQHGTFMASILAAERSTLTPGICPGCTLLVRPIFSDRTSQDGSFLPQATPEGLAAGLLECVDAGVHVVNLSAAIVGRSDNDHRGIKQALDEAMKRGTLVVAAAGNQGSIGSSVITGHPWVIPVVAYARNGRPLGPSNLGASIGRRGLGAPGESIAGLSPSGEELVWSGTSVATPFVTGAIALLRSEFPSVPADMVRFAVTRSATSRRSIVPPLLDARAAWAWLHKFSGGEQRGHEYT